jgi:hypothetical protein
VDEAIAQFTALLDHADAPVVAEAFADAWIMSSVTPCCRLSPRYPRMTQATTVVSGVGRSIGPHAKAPQQRHHRSTW